MRAPINLSLQTHSNFSLKKVTCSRLDSRVGKAISRPSSFPSNAQLLVFALRNLSNENEAAILSLSAYSGAVRRSLESPKSIFFIDESPILFPYPTISRLIGRLCAIGAKAGIRVFLSGQDPDTTMNSVAEQQILQNMNTQLIGQIQPLAIKSFVRLLHYVGASLSAGHTHHYCPQRHRKLFPEAIGTLLQQTAGY